MQALWQGVDAVSLEVDAFGYLIVYLEGRSQIFESKTKSFQVFKLYFCRTLYS